jgi:hypothetical protein
MKLTREVLPSDCKAWYQIDQSKANKIAASDPLWYVWYEDKDEFYPHRKPTVDEILNDTFK